MAVIQGGGGPVLEVGDLWKAARFQVRPLDVGLSGSGGHYRIAAKSGTIAAALAAAANLFTARWASSTHLCLVTHLRTRFQGNVAFTAAAAPFCLGAYIARSFSSSPTNQTAIPLTGSIGKLRTTFPTSQFSSASGDVRIAATGAITPAPGGVDAQPFALGGPGRGNVVNAAAGTEYAQHYPFGQILYKPEMGDGECPIVLAQNEGITIQNMVVWPAAGTGELSVEFGWIEVPIALF